MELWARILLSLAGLMGAAGVAAAAAATHVTGGELLQTAAYFLLFHAAAVAALSAAAAGRRVVLAGASLIVVGALLFSGDLVLRALADRKLLGGSAPFGGTIMILGWLAVAAGALIPSRH